MKLQAAAVMASQRWRSPWSRTAYSGSRTTSPRTFRRDSSAARQVVLMADAMLTSDAAWAALSAATWEFCAPALAAPLDRVL